MCVECGNIHIAISESFVNRMDCHAKSMAWTNRVIFPGFIMWATVLWLFGCFASLDGPLVTNSLFSQTCLSHLPLGVAWAVASFLRGEGETLNTPLWGGFWPDTDVQRDLFHSRSTNYSSGCDSASDCWFLKSLLQTELTELPADSSGLQHLPCMSDSFCVFF